MLSSTPADLLSGRTPSIISALDIDSYVHNILMNTNDDYKSGNFKIIRGYTGLRNPMIFEDKYGTYNVYLQNLTKNMKIWLPSAVDLSSNVKNRLLEIRGNEYDYSLLVGLKDVQDKLNIICRLHGVFQQNYFHHKSGSGCPKCGTLSAAEILKENPTGWSHTSWIKTATTSKNFDSFKTYVIKFTDKETNEQFIKIGRTFLTIHLRFNEINRYYNKEILYLLESENPKEVIDKELMLLKLNKTNKFLPSREFHGKHECFSKVEYD